ncbi:glycosyltransferase [Allosediminivita pacifica]|uniref:Glycosyltransferase involved in cell wall biosynthesis n=1 Tax=Allosediminivita pacifica TaxID=1267769 RepID=A0A2T6A976_9RHOB|nr:glycosyltransferase [Allosediminivita pacifica]PTX40365.1 glycosyltransferase involved in cell wall biosynthesis [Allosediminivita pacifica]GGB26361.1 glycosyl transferase [Allosediminivita pacifica]
MNLLFVVRTYPYPPYAGDLRFNADLISALAMQTDVNITVFCGSGLPENPGPEGTATWTGIGGTQGRMADLRSILGSLPRAAERAMSPEARRELGKLLDAQSFDAVVLSESCTAPAAEIVASRGLPIIYVSHNVDIDIRPRIASEVTRPGLRQLQHRDAEKYRRMELALLERADGITAITSEDAARYRDLAPGKPVVEMSPGYSGKPAKVPENMAGTTEALAVIVGSFEWNAKLRNLDTILSAYERAGGQGAGFRLRIAGRMAPGRVETYRAAYPDVEFTGEFGALEDVVSDARMALVLEDLGGGFKLKILDYIFSRLAIVAYPHAMAGSGLTPGAHYVAVDDPDEAMTRISELVGDIDELKTMSTKALEHAQERFSWEPRASALLELCRGET